MTAQRWRVRSAASRGWSWAAGVAILLAAGAAVAAEPARSPAPEAINLWPVYDERDDAVGKAHATGALGPILETTRAHDGSTRDVAVRPLFHLREERQQERLEWEVLYPLMQYTRSEQDWEFSFLYALNFRGEGSTPATREARYDLFPFYFSGRSETGEQYRAVLPFGGRALDRLGQDEIEFVLFPLYARFVKLDVETRYAPWPIISWTRGEKRSGFRIIPFYGKDTKEGVFEKRFVLWPFFLQQRTGLDGDDPEETLAILPFYVSQRSRARDSTTILWPFFTHTVDREKQYEQWDLPWPLIKVARGEGRRIDRFLPLFSVEERVLRNEFLLRELKSADLVVLFPLYIRSQEQIPGSRKIRHRVLWWLYSDTREEGSDGSTRRVDAWPLFRYHRDREGRVIFQSLALLEAFLPGNELFERNWSPLWAIYTYRRNPEGDEAHSVLWNLVRYEATREGLAVEVLGPLFAYREQGEESRLSLLAGLLSFERSQATRSVRLLGQPILTWRDAPQRAAALDPAGGNR